VGIEGLSLSQNVPLDVSTLALAVGAVDEDAVGTAALVVALAEATGVETGSFEWPQAQTRKPTKTSERSGDMRANILAHARRV